MPAQKFTPGMRSLGLRIMVRSLGWIFEQQIKQILMNYNKLELIMIDVKKYDKLTYSVIGAAMEVHREIGCGFLENVYQKAMIEEMSIRLIPFLSQNLIDVFYKNKKIAVYVPDFIAGDSLKIIIELKALEVADYNQVQMQIINYLVATKYDVGLFLNFGKSSLEYKRYVRPEKLQKSV